MSQCRYRYFEHAADVTDTSLLAAAAAAAGLQPERDGLCLSERFGRARHGAYHTRSIPYA